MNIDQVIQSMEQLIDGDRAKLSGMGGFSVMMQYQQLLHLKEMGQTKLSLIDPVIEKSKESR